jgi:hypothetical protein
MGSATDAAITQAAAPEQRQTETPNCEAPDAECADDELTEARLRAVFRATAITSLQRDVAVLSRLQPSRMRRPAFQLGAVDARRAILATAQRPAAASLDTGAQAMRFQAAAPEARPAVDVLDEAYKRRVGALRRHEPTWVRLRAWAAQPVHADMAAEAWLRTAMGDFDRSMAHALQVRAEQVSIEFAQEVARTGNPSTSRYAVANRSSGGFAEGMTARDRKLFADFSAEAPERVSTRAARYQSGAVDPGSLRRTPVSGGPGRGGVYGNLFPAAANTGSVSSRGHLNTSSARATRVSARSYGRVRFSARVGGVVFGRPPEPNSKTISVVDLQWRYVAPDRVLLQVTAAEGDSVELGSFHPAIVQHALAYAADGRVVVATLPLPYRAPDEAFNIPARRVLVHPAFEDTAFACSAIQIDRFVDGFTGTGGGDPAQVPEVLQRIERARYGVTMLGRVLAMDPSDVSEEVQQQWLGMVQAHAQGCPPDQDCFPIASYREMGFDLSSADALVTCLRDASDSAQALSGCRSQLGPDPTRHSYSVDSGVRELPYVIDAKFDFVTGAANEGNPLWPIEFIIQAVPQTTSGEDAEVPEGRDPWQFPAIAAEIQGVVLAGIRRDSGAREVFRNARDFVVLQRLFRAALDGYLGEAFPLESLVKLSADTRAAVKVLRHERWNRSGSLYEFLRKVRAFTLAALEQARMQGLSGTCGNTVSRLLDDETADPAVANARFWDFMVDFDSRCGGQPMLQELETVQQELRRQELLGEALALTMASPARNTNFYCDAL